MMDVESVGLVAARLGQCTVSTSALNWVSMHSAHIIAINLMPQFLVPVGDALHDAMDHGFAKAVPNPMETEGPSSICTVTLAGGSLLSLIGSLVKIHELCEQGTIELIVEGANFDLKDGISSALASFRQYLLFREVDAETLLPELFG